MSQTLLLTQLKVLPIQLMFHQVTQPIQLTALLMPLLMVFRQSIKHLKQSLKTQPTLQRIHHLIPLFPLILIIKATQHLLPTVVP
jgi:hypothetical protein